MLDQNAILLTMLGMLVVTYIPRVLPLWLFTSKPLPPPVIAWLRYVPVAVLAALLLPALVITENNAVPTLDVSFANLFLWAAIPTFIIAWKTRSLFGPVIVGMVIVAVIRFIV
ncbi:MAG: AzlD domain-containing protein [Anaerolineae bacterium]